MLGYFPICLYAAPGLRRHHGTSIGFTGFVGLIPYNFALIIRNMISDVSFNHPDKLSTGRQSYNTRFDRPLGSYVGVGQKPTLDSH